MVEVDSLILTGTLILGEIKSQSICSLHFDYHALLVIRRTEVV